MKKTLLKLFFLNLSIFAQEFSIDLLSQLCGHLEITTYDVENNNLFVISGNRLEVFDYSQSDKFEKLGEYNFITDNNSKPTQIKAIGKYLYSSNGNKGLQVLDISNLNSISLIASYKPSITNTSGSFIISKNIALISQVIGYSSSHIIFADITNPLNIKEIGTYRLPFYSENFSFTTQNNFLYIVAKQYSEFNYAGSDLLIVDIFDISNPALIYQENSAFRDIAIKDNYLFTADNTYKLKIFDVSDNSNPKIVNELSYDIISNYLKNIDFTIENNNLVVSQFDSLGNRNCWIYTLNFAKNPKIIDSLKLDYEMNNPHKNVMVENGKLFTNKKRKVEIYDLSEQKILFEKQLEFLDEFSASDVIIEGNYAYLLSNKGFYIIDISNKKFPLLKSYLEIYSTFSLFKDKQFLYACGSKDLSIIDISDLDRPKLTGYLDSEDWTYDIFVQDNFAYLTSSNYGFDTSTHGFKIIDLNNKENPNELIFAEVDLIGQGIYADSNYVYIATGAFAGKSPDSKAGLHIFDITNLSNIKKTAYIKTKGQCASIEVKDNVAFIANGEEGVQIIDVSDKFKPRITSSYSVNTFTYSVNYDNEILFVAAGLNGFLLLDVTNIYSPYCIGSYNSTGITFAIDNQNENIVIADGGSGMYIYEFSIADSDSDSVEVLESIKFNLEQNYPNPFNPATKISYSVAVESQIQLIIFDILGKEVETLVDQKQLAGSYEVEFYASGLASGIYFYKLDTENFSETKKMILVR